MWSEFLLCLRTFVMSHRIVMIAWGLAQVALLILFRLLSPFTSERSVYVIMAVFNVAYAASFYGFIAYLGMQFNIHRRQSWLRQLPFSSLALLLVPVSLISMASLWYFITLLDIWRENYLYVGPTTMALLFVLPFFNFYLIRNAKRLMLSAAIGIVVSILFLAVYASVLAEWHFYHYGLVGEWPYFAALVLMSFLFERRHWLGVLPVIAVSSGILAVLLMHASLSNPATLKAAVTDLKFYPTASAVENFRRYATEPSYWRKEPGQHAFEHGVHKLSKDYATAFLSDNDIASFLKNIVDHSENFIAPGSGLVPYSFSNPFPLDRKSLGPAAKLLLVSSWQDSQVYCYFLPRDIESEYLQLAFNSKECRHELVDFFSFYPYPHLKAAEVERLDAVLTSDRKAMPSENRETLARLLKNVTQLPADIENKFSQANWYKEAAMPSEAVAEFKKYYFYERRKKIAEWLRNGREAFVLAINDLNTTHRGYSTDTDRENQQALRYLCLHVSERCGGEVSPDVRSSLGYILGKRQRTWKARRGLHWEETRYQLAQEVLKAEYWEKLTALKILE